MTHQQAPVALVAPDKFKGSLTAEQVATALAAGLHAHGVGCRLLPLADGGDGSVASVAFAGYHLHTVTVADATGRPHPAQIADDGATAVVEVANTCGLADLGDSLRPLDATSRGFGEPLRAALELGASTVVLALGGSASTDGGAGLLAALGARFLDEHSAELLPDGRHLARVARVDRSALVYLTGVDPRRQAARRRRRPIPPPASDRCRRHQPPHHPRTGPDSARTTSTP
jgi:glycerate 2-kinase